MWRNTILSLTSKAYLSYNAIYFLKGTLTLTLSTRSSCWILAMDNVYGQKCLSHQNYYQHQELGLMSLVTSCAQTNQPHGCLRKAILVLFFEGPTLHLCFSNCFLHLWKGPLYCQSGPMSWDVDTFLDSYVKIYDYDFIIKVFIGDFLLKL